MALTVNRLGMSLMRMGRSSETVRFLDDVDITFSLDSRSSSSQYMTNMELTAKPIIFRASYRDINLITSIVNKAVELYSESQNASTTNKTSHLAPASAEDTSNSHVTKATSQKSKKPPVRPVGTARVLMSKEQVRTPGCAINLILMLVSVQLKGSFDGFRLVLIGDLHEQPMLHLKVKPFIIGAKDWSGEVLNILRSLSSLILSFIVTSFKPRQPWPLKSATGT